MKVGAAAFVLLLTACSSTSAAHVSPSPSATPSPSSLITTAPSAVASPSSADLPVSQVGFSCRLPVMVETTGNGPASFQGGFVTFPAATFATDPRGLITSIGGGAVLTARQAPELSGAPQAGLPTYDAAQNRWLPVGAAQATPDGASYAYSVLGEKKIHVVSVATGAERTFAVNVSPAGASGLAVQEFDGSEIYFTPSYPGGPPSGGPWRLDVDTGAVTKVAQLANVFAVRAGAAWVGFVDPHDPTPPTNASGSPEFDGLARVVLATGERTTWAYRPGRSLVLNSVDATGHVVLTVYDPSSATSPEIRHLSGPVLGGEDNGDFIYSGPLTFDVPQIDGDRVWLGNEHGIYLYTPDGGLQKVYAVSRPDQSLFPAGVCN